MDGRACMVGGVRTGDGVNELAVDEELGEPDLHLGHLEHLAAPVRSRHAAAAGADEERDRCGVFYESYVSCARGWPRPIEWEGGGGDGGGVGHGAPRETNAFLKE